ncbi:MAG: hypothetical protein L0170_13720 [Acidobacteria bacterium]|nr:hypothetical protein [Acidobacteriota bacterium]
MVLLEANAPLGISLLLIFFILLLHALYNFPWQDATGAAGGRGGILPLQRRPFMWFSTGPERPMDGHGGRLPSKQAFISGRKDQQPDPARKHKEEIDRLEKALRKEKDEHRRTFDDLREVRNEAAQLGMELARLRAAALMALGSLVALDTDKKVRGVLQTLDQALYPRRDAGAETHYLPLTEEAAADAQE